MKANQNKSRQPTKLSQISEQSEEHAFKEISNSATSQLSKKRSKKPSKVSSMVSDFENTSQTSSQQSIPNSNKSRFSRRSDRPKKIKTNFEPVLKKQYKVKENKIS
jgi:hypothetical protein